MGLFSKFFSRPASKPQEKTIIGMVLLPDTGPFSYPDFIAELNNLMAIESQDGDKNTAVLRIAGQSVYVMHIPNPIPADDIQGTAQYMYNWPTAAEDVKDHQSHIIVAVNNNGAVDTITQFRILTRIICVLLVTTNALAVYLGDQSLLTTKEVYLHEASTMSSTHLPLNIWIYFGLRTYDNIPKLYTYGLVAFGKDEIEILQSPKKWTETRELLFNIAHYVLMDDVVFKPGQTLGYTADQKIAITYSKGVFVPGKSFKLSYDSLVTNYNYTPNAKKSVPCGHFLFQDRFAITGRGLTILGELVDGTVNGGNFICIADTMVKIIGVDYARKPGNSSIGLLLKTPGYDGIESRLDKLKGQTLTIITDSVANLPVTS